MLIFWYYSNQMKAYRLLNDSLDFLTLLKPLFNAALILWNRASLDNSRNYIRRRRILAEAIPVYG